MKFSFFDMLNFALMAPIRLVYETSDNKEIRANGQYRISASSGTMRDNTKSNGIKWRKDKEPNCPV